MDSPSRSGHSQCLYERRRTGPDGSKKTPKSSSPPPFLFPATDGQRRRPATVKKPASPALTAFARSEDAYSQSRRKCLPPRAETARLARFKALSIGPTLRTQQNPLSGRPEAGSQGFAASHRTPRCKSPCKPRPPPVKAAPCRAHPPRTARAQLADHDACNVGIARRSCGELEGPLGRKSK
jgi:hypothetical protein